jgi:hypothetical protein
MCSRCVLLKDKMAVELPIHEVGPLLGHVFGFRV